MAEEITEDTDNIVQPKRGYDIFDDTAGAARKVAEKVGIVRPEAVTDVKKTFVEDIVPGSETVSKREVFVDKAKLQPYVKTESIFQKTNPVMIDIVNNMVGFRTKNTQGDGYSKFQEGSTYDDKIKTMNYMGALQYAYKKKSGAIAYEDIPYETQIANIIKEPEGYSPPSVQAILTKSATTGGPFGASTDAKFYDAKTDKGKFPEWMPFIGGQKIGVTLDKTFGTNFDETGFNLHLAKQYNKILIKAGLNSRQRLGIITERMDNKFKNMENILGYARGGMRFGLETGGYLLGEGFEILTDSTAGITDSKKRNDFYDVLMDKQANILQDGYAARGIEIDIGTAELIATMFTSTPQRLAAVGAEILIPSKVATKIVTQLGKREFRKYKKYLATERLKPGGENLTPEEGLQKFQALRNKQIGFGKFTANLGDAPLGVGKVYQRIDSILNGGRLVRGLQIDDAGKTVFKRPEVTSALATRKNILKQRDNFEEALRIKGKRTLDDEKQLASLNASLNQSTENLRTVVLESNLPQFLRDASQGNKYMIIGSAGFGQLAQEAEGDSRLFEAVGLFSGIIYQTGSNNRIMSNLLDKAYSFTNAGKKAQDLDIAKELAKRVNTFSPEFKKSLETRIKYMDELQQELITAGVPVELVKMSFAKLSGISILQTIEEGSRLNISEKSLASFGQTIEDLQKVQTLKSSLLNELSSASLDISNIRRDNDTPALIKFQNTIDKVYNFGVKRNEKISETIEQLKEAQKNEITDAIYGTTGILDDGVSSADDISTKLNTTYGLNINKVNWENEVNISAENQTISDAVDKALADKAKSLNRPKLLKEAKTKLNKSLKKDDNPVVEHDNFGDLFLTFSENVRNKVNAEVSAEYKKLDSSRFVTETGELIGTNAKVEGIGILEKFLDITGKTNETDVFKNIAGANIGSSKRANLFKGLNDAAGISVQKHFDTVNQGGQYENINEFIGSILENADPSMIKSYLPMNLQVVDVLNQMAKSRGKTIDSIPISFEQLKEMKSAFSNLNSKNKRLQESGTNTEAGGIAYQYSQLKDEADTMFTQFKVNFGQPNEQLIGDMFVEIGKERVAVKDLLSNANTMHQTYMNRFFDNKLNWNKSFKGRNKVSPSSTRPTGITLDNNPNSWFDFDKIANMKTSELPEFQDSFYELVGTRIGKNYTIDLGTQNGQTLKALMELKLSDYILDVANKGQLNSKEYITKMRNIEKAFTVGREDGRLRSLIDVNKIEKDLFSYNPASVGDKLWKKGQDNLDTRMNKLAKENVKPATEYLDQRKQVARVLQTLTSESTSTVSLAQKMFENGPQLNRAKDGLFTFFGGKVSRDRIDDLVRDVYLEDLNKNVFKTTGKNTLDYKGNLIPEVTMDMEALKSITGFNDKTKRAMVQNLIGEKRLKTFDSMINFVSEQTDIAEKASNITGVPRHFSVESYISRFYSINRGVVSARYVGTEAVLQQFRMKGHNMFKALIENPEAGQLFLEIVKTGQPLSRQKEVQFFNAMTLALSNQDKMLNRVAPEREIDLPEGWKIKYKEYEYANDLT